MEISYVAKFSYVGKKARRFAKQVAKQIKREIDKEIKEKIKRGETEGLILRTKGMSINRMHRLARKTLLPKESNG